VSEGQTVSSAKDWKRKGLEKVLEKKGLKNGAKVSGHLHGVHLGRSWGGGGGRPD